MPLILSRADVRPFFDDATQIGDCIEAVARSYADRQYAEMQAIESLGIPLPGGSMLGFIASRSSVSGVSMSIRPRGSPPDTRGLLYFDSTGRLLALISTEDFDQLRVAVPSALACRHLAPPSPRVLAVIGSGAQGKAHARVLSRALPSIQEVRIFSPNAEHRREAVKSLSGEPVRMIDAVTPREAINGADVIAACATSDTPVFDPVWIKPGALVASIARGQLPPEIASWERIFTVGRRGGQRGRDPNAPLHPAWEAMQPTGDLTQVLAGEVTPREQPDQRVLFMQMALPGVEAALASRVYQWAVSHSAGTRISLSD